MSIELHQAVRESEHTAESLQPYIDMLAANPPTLRSDLRAWRTCDELAWLRDMAARGMRQNLLTLRALVYVRRWDAGVDAERVAAFLDAKLGEMDDRSARVTAREARSMLAQFSGKKRRPVKAELPAPLESAEQQAMIRYLLYHGYRVHRLHAGQFELADGTTIKLEQEGTPDLIAVHPKRGCCYIEVKRAKGGKVRRMQTAWHAVARRDGFRVIVAAGTLDLISKLEDLNAKG